MKKTILILVIFLTAQTWAQDRTQIQNDNTLLGCSLGLESPFMSIYFPLPSMTGSLFLNFHPVQIGMKLGSAMPWLIGHIGNGDPRRHWFVPKVIFEPLEVRYHFWQLLTLGTALGYRIIGGTRGEISPALPEPKALDTDGEYSFEYREWYSKIFVGFFVDGSSTRNKSIAVEIGSIFSLSRYESFSYKTPDKVSDPSRNEQLIATNYDTYLAQGLTNYRDSVKKSVDPFLYVYLAFRYQLYLQ